MCVCVCIWQHCIQIHPWMCLSLRCHDPDAPFAGYSPTLSTRDVLERAPFLLYSLYGHGCHRFKGVVHPDYETNHPVTVYDNYYNSSASVIFSLFSFSFDAACSWCEVHDWSNFVRETSIFLSFLETVGGSKERLYIHYILYRSISLSHKCFYCIFEKDILKILEYCRKNTALDYRSY